MTPIEAMKQALEALESEDVVWQYDAAATLRTAIEQMEKQEPVAWQFELIDSNEDWNLEIAYRDPRETFTSITQAERIRNVVALVAINPAPAVLVTQEPVARVMYNYSGIKTDNLIDCDLPVGTLLYANPAPAAPSIESLRQAVARGWCHETNAHKEMDVDLAEAIAKEVFAINPAPAVPEVRLHLNLAKEVEKRYNELLMAVGNKYPNENRHQTALRYIRMAESNVSAAPKGETR